MGSSLAELAADYSQRNRVAASPSIGTRDLYNRYVQERESGILDAAAATAALNDIFSRDQINTSRITPRMSEAFRLTFPNKSIEDMNSASPESARGWLSAWKGKLFEVEVRDRFNAGETIGDLKPEPGQYARLFLSPTHPGSDLEILNADGTIANELQLKATELIRPIREALEKYPDINILTTSEVAVKLPDTVLDSGISESRLEESLSKPLDDLLDTPTEELAETVLPGLPFVVIVTTEGRKVLAGRQTVQKAVNRSVERGMKSGVAFGVGYTLAALTGAGIVSLSATFAARIGINRYQILKALFDRLETDIQTIQTLVKTE